MKVEKGTHRGPVFEILLRIWSEITQITHKSDPCVEYLNGKY